MVTGVRPPKKLGVRGQASMMIAIMISTFILFFAFVVNTGMLIHAKINLQNAADLAAYAGASAQARLMTDISYLNYEMRRQYKKFLFKYYVVGNAAQDSFPTSGVGSGSLWTPALKSGVTGSGQSYGVPSVCLIFDNADNFCHLVAQRALKFPPANVADQITQTLLAQYKQIELIRQHNCRKIGGNNIQILISWLYNTDPDASSFGDPSGGLDAKAVQILRTLGTGIGLVPRMILLKARIETLQKYLNQEGRVVKLADMGALQSLPDQPKGERSILAFMSAYNTLGNHVFSDSASITLEELLPSDGRVITLDTIQSQPFSTYAVTFDPVGSASSGTMERDCVAKLEEIPIVTPIPLGVKKTSTKPVYYAVKLTAKAQVLFNPLGRTIELKAYAAAKPFGSRIGPNISDDEFFTSLNLGSIAQGGGGAKRIPHLQIGSGMGWNNRTPLFNYYKQLGQASRVFTKFGPSDLERAYKAAMAPNPIEIGKYNIPTDNVEGTAAISRYTDIMDSGYEMALWAPLSELSDPSGFQNTIQSQIQQLFNESTARTGNSNDPGAPNPKRLIGPLLQGLNKYVGMLQGGTGEGREGVRVYRVEDPFRTIAGSGSRGLIDLPTEMMIRSNNDIFTSWSSAINGDFRNSYSVKFVTFDSLREEGATFANPGGGTLPDIDFLNH